MRKRLVAIVTIFGALAIPAVAAGTLTEVGAAALGSTSAASHTEVGGKELGIAATGPTGTTGKTGKTGASGKTGARAPSGKTGASGTSGRTGASGHDRIDRRHGHDRRDRRHRPRAELPGSPCEVVSETTGMQVKVGKYNAPLTIPRNGTIVAWTIELSQPTASQITFFDKNEGGPSEAGIAIVKQTKGLDYQLVAQSPLVQLQPYFGGARSSRWRRRSRSRRASASR